ncbi:MAG: glycosyltransferase family 25 [Homavirus sp.]|uniref:Glycosyltransferase family 25 n=1 Tax=Homavirus sp. TaxID=2487769 RepID=A0A3G5A483_9VIRU|nr:MAG: glycosyltransferase family 25 [Homavirus sp.]
MNSTNIVKIRYINLDRRPDRKTIIEEELNKYSLQYERFAAIDGTKLIMTDEVKKMFANNNFSWRRSIVGCALSHINLWKELLYDISADYYMIVEDDISLNTNFPTHYVKLLQILENRSVDLILMGYTTNIPYIDPQNPITIGLEDYTDLYLYKIHDKSHIWGGLFGYIINKSHAMRLLNILDNQGSCDPIDVFVLKNTEQIYMTCPDLVKTEFVFGYNGNSVDSDIQYDMLGIGDNYDYYQYLDSFGSDLTWVNCKSILEIKECADKEPTCVAFNTCGYLKHTICTPDKFVHLSSAKLAGIYVKKNHSMNGEYNKYVNSSDSDKVYPTLF